MDGLAAFRRAIRSGYKIRRPADVTDEMLVAMALENDRQSAWAILQECYRILRLPDAKDEEQHRIVRFFGDFDYGRRITDDANGHSIIEEGKRFVAEHARKLGNAYAAYLAACFDTATDHHMTFVIDPDGDCPEIPDWLGQAFNVTPYKDDGQPVDLERDADRLDGIKFILEAMPQRSNRYSTAFEDHVKRFMRGELSELPSCIERLITLKGFAAGQDYLPTVRRGLAQSLLDEVARLHDQEIRPTMAASNIFIKCHDACVEQVELLLKRSDLSEFDIERLKERREALRDYGSESLQRNNSGNATGLERLYRKHKGSIHSKIKRTATAYNKEETESLLAEIDADKVNAAARRHPAVREAVQIINSPDVGNHHRPILLKLQKRTPQEHKHIWDSALWADFQSALQYAAERDNRHNRQT